MEEAGIDRRESVEYFSKESACFALSLPALTVLAVGGSVNIKANAALLLRYRCRPKMPAGASLGDTELARRLRKRDSSVAGLLARY